MSGVVAAAPAPPHPRPAGRPGLRGGAAALGGHPGQWGLGKDAWEVTLWKGAYDI